MAQYPLVPRPGGSNNALNVSAKTVIKASPGTVFTVTVLAPATAGTFGIYDAATSGAAVAATEIIGIGASWPAAGVVFSLTFPCLAGIVVDPGTGGKVSVAFA
jgi:hypothetical protein